MIRKLPAGKPTTWMVNCQADRSPRRIHLQALNKVSSRETHHTPTPSTSTRSAGCPRECSRLFWGCARVRLFHGRNIPLLAVAQPAASIYLCIIVKYITSHCTIVSLAAAFLTSVVHLGLSHSCSGSQGEANRQPVLRRNVFCTTQPASQPHLENSVTRPSYQGRGHANNWGRSVISAQLGDGEVTILPGGAV